MKSNLTETQLKTAVIECSDFSEFMKKHQPAKGDFIFLDPPYDCDFSTYDNNEFRQSDQKRLADFLIEECRANWMVVKNLLKCNCAIKSTVRAVV